MRRSSSADAVPFGHSKSLDGICSPDSPGSSVQNSRRPSIVFHREHRNPTMLDRSAIVIPNNIPGKLKDKSPSPPSSTENSRRPSVAALKEFLGSVLSKGRPDAPLHEALSREAKPESLSLKTHDNRYWPRRHSDSVVHRHSAGNAVSHPQVQRTMVDNHSAFAVAEATSVAAGTSRASSSDLGSPRSDTSENAENEETTFKASAGSQGYVPRRRSSAPNVSVQSTSTGQRTSGYCRKKPLAKDNPEFGSSASKGVGTGSPLNDQSTLKEIAKQSAILESYLQRRRHSAPGTGPNVPGTSQSRGYRRKSEANPPDPLVLTRTKSDGTYEANPPDTPLVLARTKSDGTSEANPQDTPLVLARTKTSGTTSPASSETKSISNMDGTSTASSVHPKYQRKRRMSPSEIEFGKQMSTASDPTGDVPRPRGNLQSPPADAVQARGYMARRPSIGTPSQSRTASVEAPLSNQNSFTPERLTVKESFLTINTDVSPLPSNSSSASSSYVKIGMPVYLRARNGVCLGVSDNAGVVVCQENERTASGKTAQRPPPMAWLIIERESKDNRTTVRKGDTVFLLAEYVHRHVHVDFFGYVAASWHDRGKWQQFVIEDADGRAHGVLRWEDEFSLRAHNGRYLQVSDSSFITRDSELLEKGSQLFKFQRLDFTLNESAASPRKSSKSDSDSGLDTASVDKKDFLDNISVAGSNEDMSDNERQSTASIKNLSNRFPHIRALLALMLDDAGVKLKAVFSRWKDLILVADFVWRTSEGEEYSFAWMTSREVENVGLLPGQGNEEELMRLKSVSLPWEHADLSSMLGKYGVTMSASSLSSLAADLSEGSSQLVRHGHDGDSVVRVVELVECRVCRGKEVLLDSNMQLPAITRQSTDDVKLLAHLVLTQRCQLEDAIPHHLTVGATTVMYTSVPTTPFDGIQSYCKRYTVSFQVSSTFAFHVPAGFQWYSVKKCAKILPVSIGANMVRELTDAVPLLPWDAGSVANVFKQYSVQGFPSEKFKDLANDLRYGSCTLQAHERSLYRVVDVTLLLLQEPSGSRHLVQIEGGSAMSPKKGGSLMATLHTEGTPSARWPGTKRAWGESNIQAIERVLPRMGLSTSEVSLNFFTVKQRVEKQVSLAYPGLQSIYRKHFVQGKLINTGKDLMDAVGLDG